MYIKCRKNLQFCCDRRKYCYFDYKQNGNKKGKLELLLSVKQAATSGSQETQLPSAIHPVGDERAYGMPRRVRKSINCRVFLGYFTIAPLTWLQLCLLGFLSFFVCQVCLLHCPPYHYLSQNYCCCCCCWWCRRCHCSFLFSAAVVAISLLCRIVWHLLSSAYLDRQQAAKKQLRCFN